MHLEATIERVWRCNWKPESSDFGDALAGHDSASLAIHLQAVIEWIWRCNWKPWLRDFGDAFGGRNRASLAMHLETVIERAWRCTWRPWWSGIGGVQKGGQSGGDKFGREAWWERRLYSLVNSYLCECRELSTTWSPERWETGWEREAVDLGMMEYMVYAVLSECCTWCMLYSVYAILGVCCTWWMLYSVYTVLGVCCTQCILYLVYAVLSVNSWSWHGEIERDDLTSCSLVMVELRTRKREMGGNRGNHHEKLGLKRMLWASQFIIPDATGTSPNPACNNTNTRSSQPNRASCTPDNSYPLLSSALFSNSSPISLFLVHNSTIIAEHKVKSSLSIPPCHYHEMAPSIAYTEYSIHRVQHTPSTAYTKYSIHWVQHTPGIASIQHCLSSLHLHDYELTHECTLSFWRASPWEVKGKLTLSHSRSCEFTNQWK